MATLPTADQFNASSETQDQFKAAMTQLLDYLAANKPFPVGTRMLFQQTAAPTGWSKEATGTYDNSAMRIVIGTVSTGGADNFSSTFGVGKTTSGYALQVADMPAHVHGLADGGHSHSLLSGASSATLRVSTDDGAGTTSTRVRGVLLANNDNGASDNTDLPVLGGFTSNSASGISVTSAGGGAAHSHALSNMNLKYTDCIIATLQ